MTLANKITFFRLAMTPVFLTLIFMYTGQEEWPRYAALAVYALAALSDGVDGYIARNYNQCTKLGARLDPLADKMFINLGLIFVAANPNFRPHLPLWFPVLVLARDVMIVVGSFYINHSRGHVTVKPHWMGKLATFVQMTTLIAVLFRHPVAEYLLWASVILIVLSGARYLLVGMAQAGRRKAL